MICISCFCAFHLLLWMPSFHISLGVLETESEQMYRIKFHYSRYSQSSKNQELDIRLRDRVNVNCTIVRPLKNIQRGRRVAIFREVYEPSKSQIVHLQTHVPSVDWDLDWIGLNWIEDWQGNRQESFCFRMSDISFLAGSRQSSVKIFTQNNHRPSLKSFARSTLESLKSIIYSLMIMLENC